MLSFNRPNSFCNNELSTPATARLSCRQNTHRVKINNWSNNSCFIHIDCLVKAWIARQISRNDFSIIVLDANVSKGLNISHLSRPGWGCEQDTEAEEAEGALLPGVLVMMLMLMLIMVMPRHLSPLQSHSCLRVTLGFSSDHSHCVAIFTGTHGDRCISQSQCP